MNKNNSKIKIKCHHCGKIKEKFPSQIKKYNFCSRKCYFESDIVKNRPQEHRRNISKSKKGKKLTKEHKEKTRQSCLKVFSSKEIKEKRSKERLGENNPNWKGGISNKNIPFYDTYVHRIRWCEDVRRNNKDFLEVKCTYCNKWFIPKATDVQNRIKVLNGKTNGEYHLYCSDECKGSCSIFKKKLYQEGHIKLKNDRPYQQEWSQIVKEEANFECEICGSKENLIAHHILPVKTHPHLQADVDNGMCLCEDCHKDYGHKDECSTGKLASMVC